MINQKQIKYLMTVVEEKNITSASKKLFVSQPALSRMILDIEKELGTPLFIRNRGNLQLTNAGKIYINGCRDVLMTHHNVLRAIEDLKDGKSGKIMLGVTSLTGEFLLPNILESFEKVFPNVELSFMEAKMSILEDVVRSGKIDIAFVYDSSNPELTYEKSFNDNVYIQVPKSFITDNNKWSPGINNPKLHSKDLSGQDFILLKHGRGMRDIADDVMDKLKIIPGRIIEIDNIHLAGKLVALNRGFTFMPGIAISGLQDSITVNYYTTLYKTPIQRTLFACYRKNAYISKAERYIMDLCRNLT